MLFSFRVENSMRLGSLGRLIAIPSVSTVVVGYLLANQSFVQFLLHPTLTPQPFDPHLRCPYFPTTVQYMGFNNRTCANSDKDSTASCGPILRNSTYGSISWKTWTFTTKNKLPDGSYIAQLTNYFDPKQGKVQYVFFNSTPPNTTHASYNSYVSFRRCVGNIAVETPTSCTKGNSVKKVHIHPKSSQSEFLDKKEIMLSFFLRRPSSFSPTLFLFCSMASCAREE